MKIIPLKKNDKMYSCNSYLILGDWNQIGDVNTLIDPGIDDFVLKEIEHISTGCGKVAVEQILLSHNHFDHAAGVMAIKQRYGAKVLAFTDGPGVDELLPDGCFVKAGDDFLEVIHTPGHSSDSICLYAPSAKALFSGDTQLKFNEPCESYAREYTTGLIKLAGHSIQSIYSGHDAPRMQDCQRMLLKTVEHLKRCAHAAGKKLM